MVILPARLPSTPEMTWSSGESSTTSGSTRRIFRDLIHCLDNKDDINGLFSNLSSPLRTADQISATLHDQGCVRGAPRALDQSCDKEQHKRPAVKTLKRPRGLSQSSSTSSQRSHNHHSKHFGDGNLNTPRLSLQPGMTNSTVIYVNIDRKVEYEYRDIRRNCPHEPKRSTLSTCSHMSGAMETGEEFCHKLSSDVENQQQQGDLQWIGGWHTDCQPPQSTCTLLQRGTHAQAYRQQNKHESLFTAVDVSFNVD